MTPAAIAALARREARGPTYEVVRSSHLIWRWWVFLSYSGEAIDEALRIRRRSAERLGREWVDSMHAAARKAQP